MMQYLADLRKDYSRAVLDVSNTDDNPIRQFELWFEEAMKAEVLEANAMTLSTVGVDNKPSARIVLLKGIEGGRFVFFTNYQSDKGKALDHNPACALTFFWPELERQVRVEGTASRVDAKRSETYFQSRPRGSQIGAWASPQSSVIDKREILEERVQQLEERFTGQAVLPKPQQWGGYEIEPLLIEFWQGRPSRLHDRIEYTRVGNEWKRYRLAP